MEFCDLTTGKCGPTQQPDEEAIVFQRAPQARVLFATDPVCSHCWGLEPVWRRFLYHYGSQLQVRYIYGGLLPSWDGFSHGGITSPADLVPHFAEVAEQYGQPIDSSIWVKDPPASSFPASIAIHVVREIAREQEEHFLRRVRQALFLESRNIARPEVLAECAGDIGLYRKHFLELLQQGRGKIGFQRDLQEVQQLRVTGFPTLIIQGQENQGVVLRGGQPFSRLEQALLRVTQIKKAEQHPNANDVLRAYSTGTTREFAEVLNLSHQETVEALTQAGAQRKALAGDALWSVI